MGASPPSASEALAWLRSTGAVPVGAYLEDNSVAALHVLASRLLLTTAQNVPWLAFVDALHALELTHGLYLGKLGAAGTAAAVRVDARLARELGTRLRNKLAVAEWAGESHGSPSGHSGFSNSDNSSCPASSGSQHAQPTAHAPLAPAPYVSRYALAPAGRSVTALAAVCLKSPHLQPTLSASPFSPRSPDALEQLPRLFWSPGSLSSSPASL